MNYGHELQQSTENRHSTTAGILSNATQREKKIFMDTSMDS